MMIIQDNLNNGKPYLECPTCGLRFQIEGFPENPQEIRETEWFGLNICIADIEKITAQLKMSNFTKMCWQIDWTVI